MHNSAIFTSNVLNNKRFRQMKRVRLGKNVILWAISRREISPLIVIFLKKLINLHGGQLDVTKNIYLKSCAYRLDSKCCTFFHGNLSNPKSSEDTLLYLYVIWNMLKSADLHETILTPVICHKHVSYHDAVFLREVSISRSKEDKKWIFFIYFSRFPLSEVKTTIKKRKTSIERSQTLRIWEYKSWLVSGSITCKT